MEFQDFINEMKSDLQAYFTDKMPGLQIGQQEIAKLQGQSYTALTVFGADRKVGMNINMDRRYEQMQNDTVYDELLDQAAGEIEEKLYAAPEIDIAELLRYETVKDKMNGASALFYPDVLDACAKQMDGNFSFCPRLLMRCFCCRIPASLKQGETL